jgi:hypothetical protein
MVDHSTELMTKLNRETSRIGWEELQGFYAQGAVLVIAPDLDLIMTAAAVANDDAKAIAAWMAEGKLVKASEQLAQQWFAAKAEMWAVVVAPWVLVQPERVTQ